jgi:nicotinamide-nucleotide amidase
VSSGFRTEERNALTRAAVISVGNELLFGETVDTNAAWLGRELGGRGIQVVRQYTVGDVEADIREALSSAMTVADLVLITGGLGPTPDDLTKAAVAGLLERDLVEDEGARADVAARFRAGGYEEIPPLSVSQYQVPQGARVLRNPEGTAPGLLLESGRVTVALFPGVPRELKAIVTGDFAPVLDDRSGAVVHHRVVHTTGIFETRLAEALEPAIGDLPSGVREGVRLAYLPDRLGVDLRLTTIGGSAAAANAHFDAWVNGVADTLAPWSFEAESGDLAEAVVTELERTGRTLAVAESCTGGLIGARITAIPGSSRVFVGGVIAYANEAKIRDLGVSAQDLERDGAVSSTVARQLATGAAQRFRTDVGIGVTGVAGPGGGSDEKPVGTVWIGVSVDGEVETFVTHFPGDRGAVRARAAQVALARVYRRLQSLDGD